MADLLDMTEVFRIANVGAGDTVYVAFDTSGAVPSELCDLVHHSTANACKEVAVKRIVFMQFDTSIACEAILEGQFDMLRDMPMHGGGGTLLLPVLERVSEDKESSNPKKLIVVTDGMISDDSTACKRFADLALTFALWEPYGGKGYDRIVRDLGEVVLFDFKEPIGSGV